MTLTTPLVRPYRKPVIHVSSRHRIILHRLLNGEARKCSATALDSLQRRGWITGACSGYQFTGTGRMIAEHCEKVRPGQDVDIEMS